MTAIRWNEEARGLRFDTQVLGQPQPWTAVDRGLEYPGEVVVAESVDPSWGRRLEGDVYFRIVFYTVSRRIPATQIRDPRIAMAVPRSASDPARESLGLEIQAIHETKERYVTATDRDAQALRSSLDEQEESLQSELTRREAVNYSQGRIYTSFGMTVQPSEIFAESSAQSWVDRLVGALYRWAYPSLPYDYREFPATLTSDQITRVYRGLFRGDSDAIETAAAYGVALGLSTRDNPGVFDATGCSMVEAVESELGSRGGEMRVEDLLQLLCYNYGLNRTLATLYLLAYVRHAHAEVVLIANHSVQLRSGEPLPSDRVSWDLLQDLSFTPSIADQLGVVLARESLSWNAVLPYASIIAKGPVPSVDSGQALSEAEGLVVSRVEGLRPSVDPDDIGAQEGRLTDALEELGRRVDATRSGMESLATGLDDKAEAAFAALDRLQDLCAARSYREFHAAALTGFGGISSLSEALDLYYRLERLAAMASEIIRVRRYLEAMSFGRGHGELALKRDSVLGRIELDGLTANPLLWSSMEEGFQQLRREYAMTYLSHHAQYHRDAADLVTRMEKLRPRVEALVRFNDVPEFGGPLGTDVPDRFEELMASVRTCALSEDDISLEDAPACHECLLPP